MLVINDKNPTISIPVPLIFCRVWFRQYYTISMRSLYLREMHDTHTHTPAVLSRLQGLYKMAADRVRVFYIKNDNFRYHSEKRMRAAILAQRVFRGHSGRKRAAHRRFHAHVRGRISLRATIACDRTSCGLHCTVIPSADVGAVVAALHEADSPSRHSDPSARQGFRRQAQAVRQAAHPLPGSFQIAMQSEA